MSYADITFIVDRSGSMAGRELDVAGGLKTFVEEQRKTPGKVLFSLVQFDDVYENVIDRLNIQEKDVEYRMVARGSTALLDAIGRTIDETGARLAALPESERPSLVMIVIFTDGAENASRRFNRAQIFDKITHQKTKYSWEFVFLGANQDAIAEASNLGIDSGKALNYANNSAGNKGAYKAVGKMSFAARSCGLTGDALCFDDQDRKDAVADTP